jgi:hypothetical protein
LYKILSKQVAKVAFLTKSMAENGMSINEIANALTMALTSSPDGASQELIAEIENYIQVGLFFFPNKSHL